MTTSQAAGLSGTWAHSFEEDEGDIQVYRPDGAFAFPPSRRGRETLDFQQAAQLVAGMPGPDDRRTHSTTGITALGMNRFQLGDSRVMEVIESGPDVLKVRMS